jgi:peptidoglycan/xylan/chitin deacetylase (PgdA/CDA1 family)
MGRLAAAFGLSEGIGDGMRWAQNAVAPILLYHRFDPCLAATPWTVVTEIFRDQLNWLGINDYRIVTLRTALDQRPAKSPISGPRDIAISVDDGDATVYTEMFPIIKAYRVPVTLFVFPYAISRSADAVTWDQLKEMVDSGLVDVQFHTLSHPDFRYERSRRTPANYRAFVEFELTHLRDSIEKRLGLAVDLLAWPFGIYDQELKRIAAACGYAAAFAVKKNTPYEDSIFAIPRVTVTNRDIGRKLGTRIASA